MLLYRLESLTDKYECRGATCNTGAYNTYDADGCEMARIASYGAYDPNTHPGPHTDPRLCSKWEVLDTHNYMFGFASLTQLHTWFDSESGKQKIDEVQLGRIGIYQVPDEYFIRGTFQAIAHVEHMTLIETHNCTFRE